jgi:hypothetical protein
MDRLSVIESDSRLTNLSSLMIIELMDTERPEALLSEKQFELIAKACPTRAAWRFLSRSEHPRVSVSGS